MSGKCCDLREVVVDDSMSGHANCVLRATRCDRRIAVAITPNPGAKNQQLRKLPFRRLQAEHVPERLFKLVIKTGQSVEEHHGEEVQTHVDLISNRGLVKTDFIGLPKGGDLSENLAFVVASLAVR